MTYFCLVWLGLDRNDWVLGKISLAAVFWVNLNEKHKKPFIRIL